MYKRADHYITLNREAVKRLIYRNGYTLRSFSMRMNRGIDYMSCLLKQYGGACRIDTARQIAEHLSVGLPEIMETNYLTYLRRKGLIKREGKPIQFYCRTECGTESHR